MHPYRDPPPRPRPPPPSDGPHDDRVVAAVIAAVGLVRVIPALLAQRPFVAEPSIALLAVVLGVVGLVRRPGAR
jgi:hypothetical protein